MSSIPGCGVDAGLDDEGNEPAADVDHDVDLMVSAAGSKVRQMPTGGIDVRAQLSDDERFDVTACKRGIGHQLGDVNSSEGQRKRSVDQLSFRVGRDPLEPVGFPCR